MIKVGFLLNFPLEYKGGVNYLKNLFYAINKYESDKVELILFVSNDLNNEYLELFDPYAKIIKTKILKRKSLQWFLSKLGTKIFKLDILTYYLLKKYEINVISHSNIILNSKKIKTINWIPDFQYLHYSDLWTKKQLQSTTRLHDILIKKSNAIVLSSKAAYQDFKINYLSYKNKVRVLNFVSQPDSEGCFSLKKEEIKNIEEKYKINKPFFYLPNQFWTHKNHLIVFEAVKILKNKGINILVVTSGLMKDYRNGNDHVHKLMNYVHENNLKENILFLGLIPYSDVIKLILFSKCIINPSLFEGWSSSVEESKTAGKQILLSNIPVHLEQNPEFGTYFDPNNPTDLALKMEHIINEPILTTDKIQLIKNLEDRTKKFAKEFISIIESITKETF